jgi:hypothetical protein
MWRSIYNRVGTRAPFVFSEPDLSGDATRGRGTEKRRKVLAFVEANPQELRPYRRM